MKKTPLVLAFIAAVCIIALGNPSGVSWFGMADFSVPGTVFNISLISMIFIGGFLLLMIVYSLTYLKDHKLSASVFIAIFGLWTYFWIVQFESRGGSLMSNATLVYIVTVFTLCMSMGTMVAISDRKGKPA